MINSKSKFSIFVTTTSISVNSKTSATTIPAGAICLLADDTPHTTRPFMFSHGECYLIHSTKVRHLDAVKPEDMANLEKMADFIEDRYPSEPELCENCSDCERKNA